MKIIKGIGVYQLIGGVMGVAYIIMVDSISLSYGLIIAICAFLLSLSAGVLILMDNKAGLAVTLLNQCLQFFSVSVFGVLLINYNPASIEFGYNTDTGLVFDLHIGSRFILNFTNNNIFHFFTLNISAVMIFFYVWKEYRKQVDE